MATRFIGDTATVVSVLARLDALETNRLPYSKLPASTGFGFIGAFAAGDFRQIGFGGGFSISGSGSSFVLRLPQAPAGFSLWGAGQAGDYERIQLGTGLSMSGSPGGSLVLNANATLADADYGDIVVSTVSGSKVFTIDPTVLTAWGRSAIGQSWVSGKEVIALTGAGGAVTKLKVGAASATDLLDRQSGDARYALSGTTGGLDAEGVRDTIGAALVAGPGAQIVVDDPGDKITISAGGVPALEAKSLIATEADYRADAQRAALFTPRELFSPGIGGGWWDIQDLSTIFSDVAGTTAATVNGPVGRVKDKSGNGNDLVCPAGNTANRPTLKQNGNLYYLWFDGVDDALQALFSISIAFDRISRIRIEAYAADHYIFGGGNAYAGILYQRTGSGNVTMFSGTDGSSAAAGIGVDVTLTEHFYAGSSRAAVNNNLFGSNGSVGTTAPGGITIADSHTGVSSPFSQMRLYELIMVDRQLSQREIGLCRFAAANGATMTLPTGIIGDSTVADNGTNQPSLFSFFSDMSVTSTATPGDTIAGQKTKWQALASGTKLAMKAVVIQIGLNDINPSIATATTIAALQDLVTTVRASVSAECRIYIAQMTPAYSRWAVVGFDPTAAQAKWQAMNDAIAGIGASRTTGVDGRITSHVARMADSSGNLSVDFDETGDHIHPNYWGRRINALAWREVLAADGLLRP